MVTTTSQTRGTAANVVRDMLLDDLLQGGYPPGARIHMDKLADRYTVSRTPVRQALMMLANDGILTYADGGFEVRAPSFDEMCELYDIRRMLECFAVEKLVAKGVPPELLRQLRENLAEQEAMDLSAPRRHAQQDQRFHELICDNCGSPMLSQMVRRCMVLSTIFNYMPVFMFPSISKRARQAQCKQHARIIAGLEAQDAKKASKAMASHLTDARRFFMLYATH